MSALFGGYIADFHSYRFTFGITAFLYFVSALVYAPLLWLVPRSESHQYRDPLLTPNLHPLAPAIHPSIHPLAPASPGFGSQA